MKFFLLFFISFSLLAADSADTTAQKAACAANTANEWSDYLNRCMTKQQAIEVRNKVQECNKVADLKQRQDCHMQIATSTTGMNSDPSAAIGKISDLGSKKALIENANMIITIINLLAGDSAKSTCMCKKIFGITALAGTLTDIYMKIETKKKLNGLRDKYKIGEKTSAYDAQYKALEYLRDEQKTVQDLAAKEKTRQQLLVIGYGAAALVAAYETFYDPSCYTPEPTTPKPGVKDATEAANKDSEQTSAKSDEKLNAASDATQAEKGLTPSNAVDRKVWKEGAYTKQSYNIDGGVTEYDGQFYKSDPNGAAIGDPLKNYSVDYSNNKLTTPSGVWQIHDVSSSSAWDNTGKKYVAPVTKS